MYKSNIGQSAIMTQILEFEEVFPNEEKLPIEEYLKGGSKNIILNTAAFFLGFKNKRSKYDDNKTFIEMFFSYDNIEFATNVFSKISEFEKSGAKISIINSYSSLKLFETFFSNPPETETQTRSEFEKNLFKAYLVLNSEFTKIQQTAFTSTKELKGDFKIDMLLFCMHYPLSDKTDYDIKEIWTTQFIKSIYLFQFLETHPKAQTLLREFLNHFNCETWQEYLTRLIPLTLPAIEREDESHTDIDVEQNESFEKHCAFIEKLIIESNDNLDQDDFLAIRTKPLYKVKDGVYRIIFNLFVVEKVFKGVYFILRNINNSLSKDVKIKELKSFFGDEFSEKTLCYKVIESIYSNKCIRYSGKELSDMKIDGAPDYYVRYGNNIVLFESKDFLISADKKMSFDFNVYEEEFGRILDYEELPNDKIKPKAVLQLINNIRTLLKNNFSPDNSFRYNEVYIYPILLTHDIQYETPGFNELLNSWFQEAIEQLESEGLFINRIKPLSVVNIDTLIYNQVSLSRHIPLHVMLDKYHENKKIKKPKRKFKTQEEFRAFLNETSKMRLSKSIPFSIFVYRFFRQNMIWKMPPLLKTIIPSLLADEILEDN